MFFHWGVLGLSAIITFILYNEKKKMFVENVEEIRKNSTSIIHEILRREFLFFKRINALLSMYKNFHFITFKAINRKIC